MSKINSRNKGKIGERELSKKFKEYGFESRRGQQFCGANGDADVVGLPNVHIECKRVEKLNISEAMAQARADALEGEVPIVFHRRNRENWLVTMDFENFMNYYMNQKDFKLPDNNSEENSGE